MLRNSDTYSGSVSLINGHVDDTPEMHKLKQIFKQVNYAPVVGARCTANLYNQFSESALNDIVIQLINLGVEVKEKV